MDIHHIRQQLKTKSIYDLPLRVTYYARVSSESDEQLNSLGNQIQYYEELIRKNRVWQFIPGYIDEGLSAATTKKREHFHRMIADAAAGEFDLILTKEITRFARNTLDSIRYTRELLHSGVGVFFQNDNINTLDEDSELRLTIMSGIAQDELRKLSSRVKFGHQQAIQNKVVLGNSRIFGYRKDHGRLVVDEEEAPLVRELFACYATGEYSMKQLENRFWQQGWRNHNGNRISHTTMSGMIANPKYKGWYAGNKVKVIDLFTKKQQFLPQEEWVLFKDETGQIVPALVSEALWQRANEVLQRRSLDVKQRRGLCSHANLLTGKLYCSHCGAPYYRRDAAGRNGEGNSRWVCSGKIKNGAASCPSFPIYENELKPLLWEVFQPCTLDPDTLVDEYLTLYRSLETTPDNTKEITALRQQTELIRKKKGKLLGFNASGQLSDTDFLAMNRDCEQELQAALCRLRQLEESTPSPADVKQQSDAIRTVLRQAQHSAAEGVIDKGFIDRYIRRITVTPQMPDCAKLEISLATGETALRQLKGRTGHMFKKMIESYEKSL